VIVSIFYERLPKFCLFCGIIGHGEDGCNLPTSQKKKRYSKELGVPHRASSGMEKMDAL
jgi:hypothetical protein